MKNKAISDSLLKWFKNEGKNYPFRATSDPYKILVCEMLLRKTTATQVANIYDYFFSKFPTIKILSKATVEDILEVIKSLGMRSRAYDLSQAAQTIVNKHESKVPNDETQLISLRGVGKYVANCVLALGYKRKAPMIDTNINRVLSRILNLPICDKGKLNQDVLLTYLDIAPDGNLCNFHYALIDLAHIVCRKRDLLCVSCPICEFCKTYAFTKRRWR